MGSISWLFAVFAGLTALGVPLFVIGLILHDEALWAYIDSYALAVFGSSAVVLAIAYSKTRGIL